MPYLPRLSVVKDALFWPTATVGYPARPPISKRLSEIGRWVATCFEALADYYAAAAMYERLSGLSDAELARRGLSRASLAHDVIAACDRAARPN
jgi:hypothetical protein